MLVTIRSHIVTHVEEYIIYDEPSHQYYTTTVDYSKLWNQLRGLIEMGRL
jgi:hypothetical protein